MYKEFKMKKMKCLFPCSELRLIVNLGLFFQALIISLGILYFLVILSTSCFL